MNIKLGSPVSFSSIPPDLCTPFFLARPLPPISDADAVQCTRRDDLYAEKA